MHMHFISYKGYRFPRLRENDTKVMKASTVMKTKEELEKEDHEAQSAVSVTVRCCSLCVESVSMDYFLSIMQKLQELLRRGTPADLKIANDLMKQMTGFVRLDRIEAFQHVP